MSRPLKQGTAVRIKTTGRYGKVFEIFEDHLGEGHHAYLIWMNGAHTPHQHDKFMRCDFEVVNVPMGLARALKEKWRVGKTDCHWDEHDFEDVSDSELAEFIKDFLTKRR